MNTLVKCKICGREFSPKGIGTHMWRMHGPGKNFDPNRGYKDGSRTVWNKGLTQDTNTSVAKIAKSKRVNPQPFELDVDDDGKLYSKYSNKKVNAYLRNIEFCLTYSEYCQLLRDAKIVSSQLGYLGDRYVLGRYNDQGPYAYGNCRFITQHQNMQEKTSHMIFRPLKCIEDGVIFNSVASAARYNNISYALLSDSLFYRNGYVKQLNKTFIDVDLTTIDPQNIVCC